MFNQEFRFFRYMTMRCVEVRVSGQEGQNSETRSDLACADASRMAAGRLGIARSCREVPHPRDQFKFSAEIPTRPVVAAHGAYGGAPGAVWCWPPGRSVAT